MEDTNLFPRILLMAVNDNEDFSRLVKTALQLKERKHKPLVHVAVEFDSFVVDFTPEGVRWMMSTEYPGNVAKSITMELTTNADKWMFLTQWSHLIYMRDRFKLSLDDYISFFVNNVKPYGIMFCTAIVPMLFPLIQNKDEMWACSPDELLRLIKEDRTYLHTIH